MRMIDADELWELLKDQREEKKNGLPYQFNAGINQAIGILNRLAEKCNTECNTPKG